ncbi:cytochrome b/b6 domain-containing protein [Tabrizicola sp.]|uniref:cytochrome b/b6 domain-containing protein n=1 Tax=Tabrizicola sp. TaxID=2005166 RepID=UPI002626EF75|nr:cytochrome b/b6 domain-containing protein [Tabrizicola sp.]MDM7931191.1 cytochrome b/b6 domain-containing protein [Tabrizicola sp.]
MSARNTERSFGTVTRAFHWLTALLILTAMPLGIIANRLPFDTAEALAFKADLFSVHKTIGIAAFLLGLARILWALAERHPAPLHPDRKPELTLAGAVHWVLYISLVAVPLSGWVHHAAVTGFAPILWPFGQTLPFVPQSETVAAMAGATHWVFTKLMGLAILLHVLGALKHHLIDKDATLVRMLRGTTAPDQPKHARRTATPLAAALLVYVAGAGFAYMMTPTTTVIVAAATATHPQTSGNWVVQDGTLKFSVRQMGAEVTGSFANWAADIRFVETPTDGRHGAVTVTIDTASLTIGSVTKQAQEPEFFDIASHPTATFTAAILPVPTGYVADGSLTLRGMEQPVALPFTLEISGDEARMSGTVTLDRRDFDMGGSYGDEASVGFAVVVAVELVAERVQ